jgi:hypothetical protein
MIELRGDRYYFVGRRGGIINIGGLKVHPPSQAHQRLMILLAFVGLRGGGLGSGSRSHTGHQGHHSTT